MMKDKIRIECDLSVIIPIFNEQDNILHLYNRLKTTIDQLELTYELIFVNDGSTDNSLFEILKLTEIDSRVFYINFSRNFGHQLALTAGLKFCKGAATVIIDADLQDPPELISDLYQKHQEGFEVVHAKRKSREGESILKKVCAKLFYRFLNSLTSFSIPLDTGDYRLIDKRVVSYLNVMPEQNKFLRGQIAWLGFKQTNVLFDRNRRKHGKTGYSFMKSMQLAIDAITSFSDKPLLRVSQLGVFISIISFLIIIYAMFSHFVLKETITGWTSLIISSMFIGGIQLLSVGVIGQYISRINKNVTNRPLYIVNETNIKSLQIELEKFQAS